jgi:hypothetical protein
MEEIDETVDRHKENKDATTVQIAGGNLSVTVNKSDRYLLHFVLSCITLLVVHLAEVGTCSLFFVQA